MVIFKTYQIESGSYNYWEDMLPDHDQYDIIVGQQIVPQCISLKHMEKHSDNYHVYLCCCYEELDNI